MNLETKITIYKFTPQLFTLTPNSVTCYQLRQKTKKDRQEWKPPNSLNLLCSGTRD